MGKSPVSNSGPGVWNLDRGTWVGLGWPVLSSQGTAPPTAHIWNRHQGGRGLRKFSHFTTH